MTMGLSLTVNIVIISIVFSLVAITAVVLRFYCRRLKRVQLGLDDYCILPALASSRCLFRNELTKLNYNIGLRSGYGYYEYHQ